MLDPNVHEQRYKNVQVQSSFHNSPGGVKKSPGDVFYIISVENNVFQMQFRSDAIEEPFWINQRTVFS